MSAGFGALRDEDVDAGGDRGSRPGAVLHLRRDENARRVQPRDVRRGIAERHADQRGAHRDREIEQLGPVLEHPCGKPDPERRAAGPNDLRLLRDRLRALVFVEAQHAERAGRADRARQLAAGLRRHRRIEQRHANAEQVAECGVQRHGQASASAGRRWCQPVSAWNVRPSAKAAAGSPPSAMSCMPSGMPDGPKPTGTAATGSPNALPGVTSGTVSSRNVLGTGASGASPPAEGASATS